MFKLRTILIAISALSLAAPAAAAPARKFLNDAVQGDRSEMTLGRLIQSEGGSFAVRAFGAKLVRDHARAHAQALALARSMHIGISDTIMPEARAERSKLQRLRGSPFDREVRRYMVRDHRKDIAEFEAQASHGDGRTAELARQTLPTLRKHLSIAEALPR